MTPKIPSVQAASLVAALLRLRGETQSGLAHATGIRAANLSVWLRGKPQVIADRRVAMLLDHLGVRAGELRSDCVHSWEVHGELADVSLVLGLVLQGDARSRAVIYRCPDETGVELVAWLRVPTSKSDAYVRIASKAALSGQAELTPASLGLGTEVISPHRLGKVPTTSTFEVEQQLAVIDPVIAERLDGFAITPTTRAVGELLATASDRMGDIYLDQGELPDWRQLRLALADALSAGVAPERLAAAIRRAAAEGN